MSANKPSRQVTRAQKRKKSSDSKMNNSTGTWESLSKWKMGFIGVIVTLAFFSNVGSFEFVNWDDGPNIYDNENVVNFQMENFREGAKEIFTTPVIGNYNPLTILSFAISKEWHGLENVKPWHLENLALHLINVFLVYLIGLMLGLSWQASLVVSLLFGVHPMRVESVTWITERKDVLFGAFYLSALALYIYNKKRNSVFNIVLITVLFILACLAKIQAVALPLTFIAVDYFMNKEISLKTILNKTHYFLISLATGLIGIHFLNQQGSLEVNSFFTFFDKLSIGAYSFVVYLIKAVVPYEMSPMYPYPNTLEWYFYASVLIAPIFAWVMWSGYKKGQTALVFGLAVFFFNVVFMLQVVGAGQGFIADRFTYIPYLGLFFIVGFYLNQALESNSKNAKVFMGIAAGYILISGIATYQQNKIWENGYTLWSHVMELYPNSATPYINKAKYLIDLDTREGYQEAFTNYSAGIELTEKAVSVLDVQSKLGELYVNRGVARVKLDQPQEALQDMNKGLELNPNNINGYKNRYIIHDMMGNYSQALEDIQTYLRNEPNDPQMWYESARTKRLMNLPQESIPDYSQAIYLDGKNPYYYYERSKAYATLGNIEEAKADLTVCLQMGYTQVDPGYRQFLGL